MSIHAKIKFLATLSPEGPHENESNSLEDKESAAYHKKKKKKTTVSIYETLKRDERQKVSAGNRLEPSKPTKHQARPD